MIKYISIINLLFMFYSCNNEGFQIFDITKDTLATVDIPSKDYRIKIYHLPSNASSQSYIQVVKEVKGVEKILENFERYNYLQNYQLINDTTLRMILGDTVSYLGKKSDTIIFKIKE